MNFLGFYRYRTNWHKLPLVSRFLCWIGRHDFEVKRIDHHMNCDVVVMYCFYCEGEKKTFPVES